MLLKNMLGLLTDEDWRNALGSVWNRSNGIVITPWTTNPGEIIGHRIILVNEDS